jgi:hypothetical protein
MKATTTINRLDHNDECVGCGASPSNFEDCSGDCPIETGEITVPAVLRYACKLLVQHPMGIGYDVRDATLTAAKDLTGEARPYPLHEAAIAAVTGFLSRKHGPDCGLSGSQLLYRMGLFVQVEVIAMTLYAAAAELTGTEFDFDLQEFGDFR